MRASSGGYAREVAAEDDEIDTRTIWLPFADGEVAISIDLTGWNSAMRQVKDAAAGISPRARVSGTHHARPS